MSNLGFFEINFLVLFVLATVLSISIFLKINNILLGYPTYRGSSLILGRPLSDISPILPKFLVILLTLILVNIYTLNGWESLIWWGHLRISNFSISYSFFILLIFSLILHFYSIIFMYSHNFSNTYYFIYQNIAVFFFFFMLSNSLYTLFFLLELLSCLIFTNFIIGSSNYKNSQESLIKSTNYSNMLFFQYWSSFFTSIFIVLFILLIYFLIGSSDFFNINYYLYSFFILGTNSREYFIFLFLFILFLYSIFVKLGLTPIQLFKIEVYKGISMSLIYFYTVFFFLVFISFFVLFLFTNLSGLLYLGWPLFILLILLSLLISMSYIFNIYQVKAFFSYSSVINSTLIVLALLTVIC